MKDFDNRSILFSSTFCEGSYKFKFLAFSLLLILPLIGNTQEKAEESKMGVIKYSKSHLVPTFKDGFDKNGFIILGSGALLGLVANQYDDKIKRAFNKKSYIGSSLTDFGNSFGTRYLNIAVAGIQMICYV